MVDLQVILIPVILGLFGWVMSKAHALAVAVGKLEARVDNLEKKDC